MSASKSNSVNVSVKIIDKEYVFACKEDEQDDLLRTASYLDKTMRKIRSTGKIHGLDRIAVMAALNISHELLQHGESEAGKSEVAQHLAERIDNFMQELG